MESGKILIYIATQKVNFLYIFHEAVDNKRGVGGSKKCAIIKYVGRLTCYP